MANFFNNYIKAKEKFGGLCVGIDPHPEILINWGLPNSIVGLAKFVDICLETFAGNIALVKPQVAFFERFGSKGYIELERLIFGFKQAHTLVLADVKRSDIGSTMIAYANGWLLPESSLACDAITVNPYLGFATLSPVIDLAIQYDKTVFVLAKTSNPTGNEIQMAINRGKAKAVYETIISHSNDINRQHLGVVGVVVGATFDPGKTLSDFRGHILVPGLGAQGVSVKVLKSRFNSCYENIIPVMARSILAVGPSSKTMRIQVAQINDEI